MTPLPTRKSLRVLFIDDHQDTQTAFRRIIESLGHVVTTGSTLAEGQAALRASEFDVVFSDVGLPDGSGWNLLDDLTLDPSVVTVAMSGYGMADDHIRSRKAGFHHHLTKPPHMDRILAILDEASNIASGD